MQTKRDQLQAYRYLVRRVLASLLGNNPESPEQPMRRVLGGTLGGIMVMALTAGVVALVGFITKPGGEDWKETIPSVIQLKESGTRFVYIENPETGEPEIREVANFVSAQLLLSNPEPKVQSLRLTSLEGVERGGSIGIVGAPSMLPSKDDLLELPWSVCSRGQREQDQSERGHQVAVLAGKEAEGAQESGDEAVVVRTPGDEDVAYFLIWNGKKLPATKEALGALQFQRAEIIVGRNWLNALPTGERLQGPQLSTRGDDSPHQVAGQDTAIGQIFRDTAAGTYRQMTTEGLRPLTESQALLLLASPDGAKLPGNVAQKEPTEANQADIGRILVGNLEPGDIPEEPPQQVKATDPDNTVVCARFSDPTGEAPATITIGGQIEPATGAAREAVANAPELVRPILADYTSVTTSKGAVVAAIPQRGSDPSAFFIVTDDGKRYGVESKQHLGFLGYKDVTPVLLPPEVLSLIPPGPGLTPEKAGREIIGQSGQPGLAELLPELEKMGIDPEQLGLGGLSGS